MTVKARPLQEFFPGGSAVKDSSANAGHISLIPGSERSPGEENDNPLQYSCLENFMDREAWWAIVHGVVKQSDTTGRAHTHTHTASIQYVQS